MAQAAHLFLLGSVVVFTEIIIATLLYFNSLVQRGCAENDVVISVI